MDGENSLETGPFEPAGCAGTAARQNSQKIIPVLVRLPQFWQTVKMQTGFLHFFL
jgi:hypothetical protein